MFDEDDLLPISALQHLAFCSRQCALIHLEAAWSENRLTAEGRQLHERTHQAGQSESRGPVHTARGLLLRSLRLGLSGKADVVEFHRVDSAQSSEAAPAESVRLSGHEGWWRPVPVEYKRGKPKRDDCDRIQLCAQAVCLEEMLDVRINGGALFYARTRRRLEVTFDEALRHRTEHAAAELRRLLASAVTPPAAAEPKCRSCSLKDQCLPELADGKRSARTYIRRAVEANLASPGEELTP